MTNLKIQIHVNKKEKIHIEDIMWIGKRVTLIKY